MIGNGKSLKNTMVRNGNCLMSPGFRPFNNFTNIYDTIHITHDGMHMQLYSFFQTGILPFRNKGRNGLDASNRSNTDFVIEFIIKCHPLHPVKIPFYE